MADKFSHRLEEYKGTNSVIRLDHACSAFSGDVMRHMCFEDGERFLDDSNFAPEWLYATISHDAMLTLSQVRIHP